MLCYACGYGIVYPSSGLCGPIFIYYKRALRVYGCMHSLRIQPYMGGPEKWQKRGRAKRVLSHFCRVVKKSHGRFRIAPLSLNCFGRFSLNSALFIHSPCQTSSQPMSGR